MDMLFTTALRFTLALVLFLIGLYLLVCAVRVKGFVYMNSIVQESKYYNRYVNFVRIFCFILPLAFAVNLVFGIMSFASESALTELKSMNPFDPSLQELSNTSQQHYAMTTASLIVSISLVVLMLCIIAVFTGAASSGIKKESLSGDHPAFRKSKSEEAQSANPTEKGNQN